MNLLATLLLASIPAAANPPFPAIGGGESAVRVAGAAGCPAPANALARIGAGRWITREDLDRALTRSPLPSGLHSGHTPEEERRFLELLVDRELLAEAALREPGEPTPEDSAAIAALRDRKVLSIVLAVVLDETRDIMAAHGDTSADESEVGIAARERALAQSTVAFDVARLERLAKAWAALPRPVSDSSLTAQLRSLQAMPQIPEQDAGKPIATGPLGSYLVGDLLKAWRCLSPAYRPRVETTDQVKDLVMNGLFERWLRLEAVKRGLDRCPEVEATIRYAEEEQAIARLVEREISSRVVPDSTAVREFYAQHSEDWAVPLRVRLVALTATSRPEAGRMAGWLRDRAGADRLARLARDRGLDYVTEVSERSDSALFARAIAAGVDGVLGPEPHGSEWWVGRVTAVLPGRPRTLAEVRTAVERQWRAEEEERRLHQLCARLRSEIGVEIKTDLGGSGSVSGTEP